MSITQAAGAFNFGTQHEETAIDSFNTDQSRAYEVATGGDQGAGAIRGADLKLIESSGNTFNLADPLLTVAASNIARDSIGMAYGGLERITEASNLAVTRALDLAKEVQGGEAGKVTDLGKSAFYSLAAVAGVVVVGWLFLSPSRRGSS